MFTKIVRAFTFGNIISVFLLGVMALMLYGTMVKPANVSASNSVAKPVHPDVILMGRVRAVNGDASTLMISEYSGFGMEIPASCLLAAHVEKDSKLVSDVITQQIHKKFQAECGLTGRVRAATFPVFTKIADSGKLPIGSWAFEVFSGQESWKVIGLFDDPEICKATLQHAVEVGFGVKPCLPWSPRY